MCARVEVRSRGDDEVNDPITSPSQSTISLCLRYLPSIATRWNNLKLNLDNSAYTRQFGQFNISRDALPLNNVAGIS